MFDAREPGKSQMAEVEAWALDKLDVTLLSAKQFAASGAVITIKANNSILDFSAIGGTVLTMRSDCQLHAALVRAETPARSAKPAIRREAECHRGSAVGRADGGDKATAVAAKGEKPLDTSKESDGATSSDDDGEGGWVIATSRRARSKSPAAPTRRAVRTRKLPVVAFAKND